MAKIIFLLDSSALEYPICLVFSLISRCFLRTVKGLEALSYLHTKKLACHSFKDASTRHETHGSNIKDSLLFIAIAEARITAWVPWVPIPMGDMKILTHWKGDITVEPWV